MAERSRVERLARKGHAEERRLLERAAEFPECLDYLAARFYRLDGMREHDMNGPRRFTPLFILGAAELFGWEITPLEAEALVLMDIARLHPGEDDAEARD